MNHVAFMLRTAVSWLTVGALLALALPARAAVVNVTWNAATDVPITSSSYVATGNSISFNLNCVPTANELTVVRNTGPSFIEGQFSNLAQGQAVVLSYAGVNYNFLANYHGGYGNDLVLVWAGAQAFAWGENTYGQLGNNSRTQSSVPVAVSATGTSVLVGETVVALAAGANHSLALCGDGTLAAWGYNYDGELGTNNTAQSGVPVPVSTAAGVSALAGKNIVAVAAGAFHSVALCSDGSVSTWGYNYDGELGNNSTNGSLVPTAVNTTPGASALAGQTVTAVAAGQFHNLAVCSNGTAVAWGYNGDGELGNDSSDDSLVPVAVDTGTDSALRGKTVVAVAAGFEHSLALCSDGTLVTWGANAHGQLGNGTTTGSLVPTLVDMGTNSALYEKSVVAIAAGAYHSMALCSDGTVVAWGDNDNGQLGDTTTTERLVPVAVSTAASLSALSGRTVVSIKAGQNHSVAECTDGTVVSWGNNFNGQLGDGAAAQSTAPVAAGTTSLAAGQRFVLASSGCNASHTLALMVSAPPAVPIMDIEQPAGTVLMNGRTVNFGSYVLGSRVPVTFTIRNNGTAGLTGLTITEDGTNTGDFVVSANPTAPVAPGLNTTFTVLFTPSAAGARGAAIHIASNDSLNNPFTINLTGTGSTIGSVSAVFNLPTDVPITSGSYTAAGNTIVITLNCVPLANGLTVIHNTGLDFMQGQFSNLAQGQAVALIYDGVTYNFVANYYGGGNGRDLVLVWVGTRVVAWGDNDYGQVGDGTTTQRSTLVNTVGSGIFAGKTVVSISAGQYHSLALCSDGTVVSWGYNADGELGNDSTASGLVPSAADTGTDSALHGKTVVAVSAGFTHSLALCSDGTVVGWGSNASGQLGTSSTTSSLVPVAVTTAGSALQGKSVVSISAGAYHSMALCSDGTVVAWGDNTYGELGNNGATGLVPVPVDTGTDSALYGKTVVAIAASRFYSMALCSDGTVTTWGITSANNPSVPAAVDTAEASSALNGQTVLSIAAGYYDSFALYSDSGLVGWGNNYYGALGNDSPTGNPSLADTGTDSALYGETVVAVTAAGQDTLALCSDGSLAAWGENGRNDLGDNPALYPSAYVSTAIPLPVDRSSLATSERFSGVSAGGGHTLALVSPSAEPPAPACSTSATNISLTTAELTGIVNANGYATTVAFEYGTDGITFSNEIDVTPQGFNGNNNVTVSTQLTGLSQGTPYYYLLTATNLGGTTVTQPQSFTTLAPPTASLGIATVQNTTVTLVSGTVNALGSSTQISFNYGTNPTNLTNSVQATPAVATGYGPTAVTALLNNLSQGTTYYYEVQGTSVAGTGTSAIGSFQVALLSGLSQAFPNAPPASNGFLLVNLSPTSFPDTTLLPGWRFVGQVQWQPSGAVAIGLVTGTYGVEYEPVPGYIQPLSETVDIVSGAGATVLNRNYYEDAGVETGALTVTLEPSSVAASGSAEWEFVGENGTQWRNSGVTASSLPAGTYLVECTPVAGYATPEPTSVTIQDGVTTSLEIPYYLPDATVGALPSVVPYQTVISGTNLPYAYVGQIQSDAGSATGFVVASRVVATAAHVVFDDATLAATTGVQWLLQEYAGTYQPAPLIPRGFYEFAGYAAQRAAEGTPGQSSPASQNLDVAAMYFLQDAGNGGYSGYLASDSTDNEFLESSNLKILVGYPVDNIPANEQGQIFATAPANVDFTRVPGVTASGTAVGVSSSTYRIYTTTDITSTGGNSGGPLCVQYNGGIYYPAAIYLGGSQETVVRAIDGDVVNMFNDAVTSGNGGGNQGSGGITETNSPISSGQQAANLKVTIAPASAISAGAGWRLKGATSYNPSGTLVTGLTPSDLTLQFSTIAGFDVPTDQPVTLSAGQQMNVTFTYSDTLPPSITSGLTLSATGGQPLSYQIAATQLPTSFGATASPAGLTVAASNGLISGTPLTVGTFSIPISASNVYGTGTKTLVLTIQSPFPLWQSANFGANAGNPLIAGDTVINNPAGIENLMAYGLGLNPFTAGAKALPAGGIIKLSGTNYLSLQFTRSSTAVDLTYTVLATSNLANPASWTPVVTYSGGTWSGPGMVVESGSAPYFIDQVFDSQPASSSAERFIQLKMSH